MNRIDLKFKTLKKAGRKAFIAFITAGYPDLKTTEKLISEFDRIGVDILELGVPFSDPMADGPIIQEASTVALKNNTRLIDILNIVKKARRRTKMPICLMTYYNPIFCFPEEKFIDKALDCGVDGVIIPDLPPEEAPQFIKKAKRLNLHVINFLSPTSSIERIKFISKISKGFVYYVSLTGVTGLRNSLPAETAVNLKKIKQFVKKPVCVGFGVSNPAQVKEMQKYSDGVIVGSAIVKKIKDNIGKPGLVKNVADFVNNLKGQNA